MVIYKNSKFFEKIDFKIKNGVMSFQQWPIQIQQADSSKNNWRIRDDSLVQNKNHEMSTQEDTNDLDTETDMTHTKICT